MRVVIPFAGRLHPAVLAAVPGAEPWEMLSERAYPDLLESLWREGRAFALVEHDVIPWPGALDPLCADWGCERPWCGYSYESGIHRRLPTFGCVRFSAELIAATPAVFAEGAWRTDLYPRDWRYCDQQLAQAALAAGIKWHQHFPAVFHARGLL